MALKTSGEKREAHRFRMEVPVRLETGTGTTRDISRSGIFFLTEQRFAPGTPVTFSIKLDYIFPGKPMQLRCLGHVVRVESAGEKYGVAAAIHEFSYAA